MSERKVDDDDSEMEDNMRGRVAAAAEKGAKQYQEDSWCLFCSEDETVTSVCIFDGHGGINGRHASRKCKKMTYDWCKDNWKKFEGYTEKKWKSELKNLFDHMHTEIRKVFVEHETKNRNRSKASTKNIVDDKGIVRKTSGYPVHGGTTGSVCITVNTGKTRQVICANVGDSDCLLLPLNEKTLPDVQKNYLHLSVDHGPDSAKEWNRINKLDKKEYPFKLLFIYDKSATYRKYECPKVFIEYGPNAGSKDPKFVKNPWGNDLRPTNVRYDPAVYAVSPKGVDEDVTCIAMTRALGDFYAHQFGLSWEPDVYIRKLDPKKSYLVVAGSDGIWDCWKHEDFSDFATSTVNTYPKDLLRATKHVVHATVERAKALFGKRSFDDASLALNVIPVFNKD